MGKKAPFLQKQSFFYFDGDLKNECERKKELKNKTSIMCLQREMNSFLWCERGKKERRKYIIQFHSKETKRARQISQEWQGRTKSIFLVWGWGGRGLQRRKSTQRRKMERVINISETTKREAINRNNESEQRNPSPSFSQGGTVADSFPIKDKESWRVEFTCELWERTVILDLTKVITSKNSVLTFYPHTEKAPLPEERTDNLLVNSCVCVQAGG